MKLAEILLESDRKLLAVIYGGRFQPFHRGHQAAYKQLCHWFGRGNVWITSSNKVDPNGSDPSFLTFDERRELMIQLYHIDGSHIVQAKNPAFTPVEVIELYKKAPTVCVLAVGKKDVERYKDSERYKPYPMRDGKPLPFEEASAELNTVNGEDPFYYYIVTTAQAPGEHMTGTKARGLLVKDKQEGFKRVFGKFDADMYQLLQAKLDVGEKPKQDKSKKAHAKGEEE